MEEPMRTRRLVSLAAASLVGSAACQPVDTETGGAPEETAAAPAELSAADLEAIRAVDAAATEAGVAGDFNAFAALYTEDAALLAPNLPAIEGRAAIRDYWASVPPMTAFEIEIDEIVGRGDLAYVRGRYTLELSPPGAPEPVRDEGKFIEIRRRQADGSWPLAVDIYNSDLAVPGAEAGGEDG
jgi:uncharacterized protein (TIGR02246 family)